MRVLITGGAGLLGTELRETAPPGVEVHATWRSTPLHGPHAHRADLAEPKATRSLLDSVRPDLVIHTAYSIRDGERDIVRATKEVAGACLATGAHLIYLSTDALLDGENAPYGEDAEPDPVHEYGEWKACAEREVRSRLPEAAVVRTSLITTFSPPDPRCRWVEDALRAGTPITLFTDEIRCPIATADLAAQVWEISGLPPAEQGGVWHLAGPEALSRYALGLLIATRAGLDPAGITPVASGSAGAPRPRDLRLLTPRADRFLRTRARPISRVAVEE